MSEGSTSLNFFSLHSIAKLFFRSIRTSEISLTASKTDITVIKDLPLGPELTILILKIANQTSLVTTLYFFRQNINLPGESL